jgi:hypothetical protein
VGPGFRGAFIGENGLALELAQPQQAGAAAQAEVRRVVDLVGFKGARLGLGEAGAGEDLARGAGIGDGELDFNLARRGIGLVRSGQAAVLRPACG